MAEHNPEYNTSVNDIIQSGQNMSLPKISNLVFLWCNFQKCLICFVEIWGMYWRQTHLQSVKLQHNTAQHSNQLMM